MVTEVTVDAGIIRRSIEVLQGMSGILGSNTGMQSRNFPRSGICISGILSHRGKTVGMILLWDGSTVGQEDSL